MEVKELKKEIEKQEKLLNYDGEDQVTLMQEIYDKEKANAKPISFGTGIKSIDSLIEGFREGELVVITGITKRGKTTFAKTLTKNNSKNQKILWFSFEESVYEFCQGIESNMENIFVPSQLQFRNMNWIEDRIVESKLKYQTKIVFIDHLHYLFNPNLIPSNASLIIGDIMRQLKLIAVKHGLTIFVLAHTRKLETSRIPHYDDVRDSALIANECDKMFIVHRERTNDATGKAMLSPETTVVIELDRKKGSIMGENVKLNFKDGILHDTGILVSQSMSHEENHIPF
jgi:replicative DNA helicase